MLIQSCNPLVSDVLDWDWAGGAYSEAAFGSPSFSIQYMFEITVSITYQYDLFIGSVNINTKL
jgi:hypothetical protein